MNHIAWESLSLYIQDVQGWLVVFKMNRGSLTSVPRGGDGKVGGVV